MSMSFKATILMSAEPAGSNNVYAEGVCRENDHLESLSCWKRFRVISICRYQLCESHYAWGTNLAHQSHMQPAMLATSIRNFMPNLQYPRLYGPPLSGT